MGVVSPMEAVRDACWNAAKEWFGAALMAYYDFREQVQQALVNAGRAVVETTVEVANFVADGIVAVVECGSNVESCMLDTAEALENAMNSAASAVADVGGAALDAATTIW